MAQLRALIGCEYSAIVRTAFERAGFYAMSCDLLPSEKPGEHYQGDVSEVLGLGWDIAIFFPPCTFVCGSGIHWNNRGRGWEETEKAVEFDKSLLGCDIPYIALENPIGILSTRIRKPEQIINPYEFGDDASKKTCLWLKGLPVLTKDPLKRLAGRWVEWPKGSGKMVERWSNQTDSGQNILGPSDDRWKLRSTTYQGIADAMAEQWGKYLNERN